MLRIFFVLLCLLTPFSLLAQGEWNQWRFGLQAGLDFSILPPVSVNGNASYCSETSVSVSDSSGLLLFYSEGTSVWNRSDEVMLNGSGLYGSNTSGQRCFAVMDLNNDQRYYLFYAGTYNFPLFYQGLYYSMIDMELDGGFGGIVTGQKNIPVAGGQGVANWLTGTRH